MTKIFYCGQNFKEYEALRLALYHRFQFFMGEDSGDLLQGLERYSPQIVLLEAGENTERTATLMTTLMKHPSNPGLVLTGQTIPATLMVEGLKNGVLDILPTPVDPERLKTLVVSFLLSRESSQELLSKLHPAVDVIIGESPAIVNIKGRLPLAARNREPVLITGAGGTGRALVARVLHDIGSGAARESRPFIRVNGGGLQASVTDDFFGQAPAAVFSRTGGESITLGLGEVTGSGTLFVENLEEMPRDQQYSLFRLLEDGVFYSKITGKKESFGGKIICSCRDDVIRSVESGLVRKELYLRLSPLQFCLPPLNQRKSDIPLLVSGYLRRCKSTVVLTPDALTLLDQYDWPGNIRELEKILKRALALAGTESVISGRAIDFS